MLKQLMCWLKLLLLFVITFMLTVIGILIWAYKNDDLNPIRILIVIAAFCCFVLILSFIFKYYSNMMENFSISHQTVCFVSYKQTIERNALDCRKIIVKYGMCKCIFIFKDQSRIACQYKYFPFQKDRLHYELITQANFSNAEIVFE